MKMTGNENENVVLIEDESMGLQTTNNNAVKHKPVVEKIAVAKDEVKRGVCTSGNPFAPGSGDDDRQQQQPVGPTVGCTINAPRFLTKTFDMVEDPETDHLISWSLDGESFIIWDQNVFASELLPKHFKHNNFASFNAQLNNYGFRKIEHDQWEYYHKYFQASQPLLLKSIKRRVPSSKKKGEAANMMQAEVAKLKIQTNNTMMELEKLKQRQEAIEIYKRQVQETLDSALKTFKTPLVVLIHEVMDQMVKEKRGPKEEEAEYSNAKKPRLDHQVGATSSGTDQMAGTLSFESIDMLLMGDGEDEWAFRAMCESDDVAFQLQSYGIYMEYQNLFETGPGAGAGAEGPDGAKKGASGGKSRI